MYECQRNDAIKYRPKHLYSSPGYPPLTGFSFYPTLYPTFHRMKAPPPQNILTTKSFYSLASIEMNRSRSASAFGFGVGGLSGRNEGGVVSLLLHWGFIVTCISVGGRRRRRPERNEEMCYNSSRWNWNEHSMGIRVDGGPINSRKCIDDETC